jgi:integrating conjugative element membrane protein (TIGR03747 family)
MSAQPPVQQSATIAAVDRGPVGMVFALLIGAVFTTLFSWMLSIVIELVGMQTVWKDRGVLHSRDMVVEDLGYIAAAPHSILVDDTAAFSQALIAKVAVPFNQLKVIEFYQRVHAVAPAQVASTQGRQTVQQSLRATADAGNRMIATVAVIALFTAQDTALRLAIVVFALPAFVLACLLGAVDGLVRRDLRKWGGGRESSFIYHHSKATTTLALGGGFSLYLAWPAGGFNPAYMVLVFTAVVAWSLSLTLSAFKKYL